MRNSLFFILCLCSIIPFWSCSSRNVAPGGSVNPILGDIGFFHKFGHMPHAGTDEDMRVREHLEYVERLLRSVDVKDLPIGLQAQRTSLLDLLHDYWSAGIFPRNHLYEDVRVPCFIDDNGRICAVGYLVEHTAGRMAAERINFLHQYDEIMAMDDPQLHAWIGASGFTTEEIAMIQPNYGFRPNNVTVPHAMATLGTTVGNVIFSTMNIVDLAQGDTRPAKKRHRAAMLVGGGQLALGVAMNINAIGARRDVSLFNIGVGATTMFNTYLDHRMKRRHREDHIQPFVFSHPGPGGDAALGLQLTRMF